ncbi:uncharacterized protein LOC114539510 [Dendronephthya gigantea]|uniref:uncharacterized protein LOC114539510 n=1 Tax=Dendronephthya gigantea TaxID=151771 RepID=UPI00106AD0E8|nr:uncharacterized protein LOC114539510 [Dendronephthya gigantea]
MTELSSSQIVSSSFTGDVSSTIQSQATSISVVTGQSSSQIQTSSPTDDSSTIQIQETSTTAATGLTSSQIQASSPTVDSSTIQIQATSTTVQKDTTSFVVMDSTSAATGLTSSQIQASSPTGDSSTIQIQASSPTDDSSTIQFQATGTTAATGLSSSQIQGSSPTVQKDTTSFVVMDSSSAATGLTSSQIQASSPTGDSSTIQIQASPTDYSSTIQIQAIGTTAATGLTSSQIQASSPTIDPSTIQIQATSTTVQKDTTSFVVMDSSVIQIQATSTTVPKDTSSFVAMDSSSAATGLTSSQIRSSNPTVDSSTIQIQAASTTVRKDTATFVVMDSSSGDQSTKQMQATSTAEPKDTTSFVVMDSYSAAKGLSSSQIQASNPTVDSATMQIQATSATEFIMNLVTSTDALPSPPTTTSVKLPSSFAIAPTATTQGAEIVSSTQSPSSAPCSTNPCDVNAVCTNVGNTFSCSCNTGYTGTGKTCTDVNECTSSPGICGNSLCENRFGSYVCKCPTGFFYIGNKCEEALSYKLEFTVIEGASYSDDLQNKTSKTYMELQKALESDVEADFKASSQSSNYLGAYLESFSRDDAQSSGGVVVTFTIFTEKAAFNATPTVLGTAFNSGLKDDTVGGIKKRILGNDYVLAKSTNGKDFSPSLDNVVADINECSQSPAICGDGQKCENLPGTYRCYCASPGTHLVKGTCVGAFLYQLEFTIIEGASYSNDLQDKTSPTYMALQKALEADVEANFQASSQSSNFFGAYLESFSPDNAQSSGGVVVNFTIFINNTAFDATPTVLGTAFNSGLNDQTVGVILKRVLGNDYVLAKSSDGKNFSPSLGNVVVDINECSRNPAICGDGQKCENYPGTYRCYCISPGKYLVGETCNGILSYEGGFVIINRNYTPMYNDKNSIEYLQFTEEVASWVEKYYLKTKFAANLVGVRVIKLYPGSVGVDTISAFDPAATGITASGLSQELESELDLEKSGKYIGPLQLTRDPGENALNFSDYDECNPAEDIHIPDCAEHASCVNLEATYNCSCNEGYTGDGVTCIALPPLLEVDKEDSLKVKYMFSTLLVFLALCIIFSIVFILLSVCQILERRKLYQLTKKVERVEMQSEYSDSITAPTHRRSAAMYNYYD